MLILHLFFLQDIYTMLITEGDNLHKKIISMKCFELMLSTLMIFLLSIHSVGSLYKDLFLP